MVKKPSALKSQKNISKNTNKSFATYLNTVTTFSKLIAAILFIALPFIGFYLGMEYQILKSIEQELAKDGFVHQCPNQELIKASEINQFGKQSAIYDNAYSSGSIISNFKSVNMFLESDSYDEVGLDNFVCEKDTKVVTAQGDFYLTVRDENKNILDKFNLGKVNFTKDPWQIEQDGRFTNHLLSTNYSAMSLAFRESCQNTQIKFFVFDDVNRKIIQVPFVRKNGTLQNFVYNPKGLKIVQFDEKGNVISSAYNLVTKWRDKVKYKFNSQRLQFEEVEAYSQPK